MIEIQKRFTFSRTMGRERQLSFVRPEAILYCKADKKYVDVVTKDGDEHMTELSITSFEKELGERVIRIHRNCIVAVDGIDSMTKKKIKLCDGSEHDISRRNISRIKRLFRKPVN